MAIDKIMYIDAATLDSSLAARELGTGSISDLQVDFNSLLTAVLIRTHSLMLWNGTSKAAVPHSVIYLPSNKLSGFSVWVIGGRVELTSCNQ